MQARKFARRQCCTPTATTAARFDFLTDVFYVKAKRLSGVAVDRESVRPGVRILMNTSQDIDTLAPSANAPLALLTRPSSLRSLLVGGVGELLDATDGVIDDLVDAGLCLKHEGLVSRLSAVRS